jgi:hypothetical protein
LYRVEILNFLLTFARDEEILNGVEVGIVWVESTVVVCTVSAVSMIVVAEISDVLANGTKILMEIWNNSVFFFSATVYDDVANVYEVMANVYEVKAIVYEGIDDEATVIDDEERLSAIGDVGTWSETGNENAI